MCIQLEFFKSKEEVFFEEVQRIRDSQDRCRKALFGRHGELAKKYMELQNRMDVIERNICIGK